MKLHQLHESVELLAPIHGLDSNGRISFKDEATPEQRTAAQAYVDSKLSKLELVDAPVDPMVATLNEFRTLREQVLNRMNGIRDDLQEAGDTAGVTALRTARQALKDLPQYPTVVAATNRLALKQAIMARYAEISATLAAASPAAYVAFRGLDA